MELLPPEKEKRKLKLARPKHLSPEEEAEVCRRLNKMFVRAKAWKEKVAGRDNENWRTLWDFYLGRANHWKGYPGALKKGFQFTNNRIRRNIKIALALKNEMNIAAEIQPREPDDEVTAVLLEAAKGAIWEREDTQKALKDIDEYASVLGIGIGRVSWDPSALNGLGDVVIRCIPAEDFYVEPGALDLEQARYVCYERRMDAKEVEARFGLREAPAAPSKSEPIGEREEGETYRTDERAYNVSESGQLSSTTSLIPADTYVSDEGKEVIVREWYIRDETYEEVDDPEQEGGKLRRRRYPNGRHIVQVGDKHIVVDEDNKYKHGKWPFFHWVDETDPRTFYGDTSARQAIEPQRELNIVESLIVLSAHLNTATPWVVYAGSGVPVTVLQKQGAKANGIIMCRPGMKPERLHPPGIPPHLLQYRDILIETIDKLMRIQDVIPPGARGYPQSGEIIRELRETQLVEIRQKAENKAHGIKRCVELIAATVQQFYKTERYVRIVGPLPRALEGLLDPETSEEIVYTPGGDVDSGTHFVRMRPDNLKGGWDVRIVESTWEPLSQEVQVEQLLKLNERDPETIPISDIIEFRMSLGPMRERILRRIRKKQQAEEQPPPEQGGGPGMPPGGPAPPGMPPGGMPPPGGPPPMGGPPPPMGPPPGMPGVM